MSENEDRPFYGNGTRWQTWTGQPAHWWNISYDTHSRVQRRARGVVRVVYVTWFAACLVAIGVAVVRGH